VFLSLVVFILHKIVMTNACTDDSCESSVGCINTPISCDDDACANDDCNALVGCLNSKIPVILKLVVFM